tara:strand:+ start:215 stop:706 length:492 start_codon:yes stop_codon:yes gene_type:complete
MVINKWSHCFFFDKSKFLSPIRKKGASGNQNRPFKFSVIYLGAKFDEINPEMLSGGMGIKIKYKGHTSTRIANGSFISEAPRLLALALSMLYVCLSMIVLSKLMGILPIKNNELFIVAIMKTHPMMPKIIDIVQNAFGFNDLVSDRYRIINVRSKNDVGRKVA